MQQIVDWLQKLGMSEYVQRFVERSSRSSLFGRQQPVGHLFGRPWLSNPGAH
jgi:hypothetical protein